MKTFEDWFYEQRGCTVEQFRQWTYSNLSDVIRMRQKMICMYDGSLNVIKRLPLYDTAETETDKIIADYRKRYETETDRYYLDKMNLDFSDWLEGYYHMTPKEFFRICEATGTPEREAGRAMERFQRRYMEYVNTRELEQMNPF